MKNKSKTGGKNLNRGRRKWFHKGEFIGLDIQSVIMTVLTMLTIAVTVVMGLLIYNRFKLSVKETNISSTEGIVDSVVEKMNSDLYNIRQISNAANYNIIQQYDVSSQEFNNQFSLLYEINSDKIQSLVLYNNEGKLMAAEPISSEKKNVEIKKQDWFYNAKKEIENIHFSKPHLQNIFMDGTYKYNWVISLSRSVDINDGEEPISGILLVDMKYSIIEETLGSKFNTEELVKNIKVALSEGKQQLDVTKANGYVKPQVYKDDQDLNNQLKAANEYCLSTITYTTPKGKEIALDGSTLITWLSKQDDGSYTKDESVFKEKLTAFVKELASQYNSIGATRTFTGKDGQSHTVSGGTYGFRVSTDSEVSALLKMINENKSENNRTPEHTGQLPSGENGGLGTTYLEINITKQHLWFVKDGSVVLESDFVSGKESDPTRLTPSGTYYIYNKERNRVLRGTKQPNGKYEYESPVSYWMPFNKGIGLHDASWRSTFGRDIYINSGSHGCINLPTGFAGSLYSQIYVNLPVVVYR